MNLIQLKNIYKIYDNTVALKNINISINSGEFISIMGPSGSGKTTLMHIASTILTPSFGDVFIKNINCDNMTSEQLSQLRSNEFSFIFQDFKLINTLTVEENLLLSKILKKHKKIKIDPKDWDILKKMHIENILDKYIEDVSLGQLQKISIARSIIGVSNILFADEPTNRLDSKSMNDIMEILKYINKTHGTTIFMVTHDPIAASYSDRVLFLKDGEIYSEIYKGEEKEDFYTEILDLLSFLGGNLYDF